MSRRGKFHKRSRKRAALAELSHTVYVASPDNGGSDQNHGRYPWRPKASICEAMKKMRGGSDWMLIKGGSVFSVPEIPEE